MTNFSEKNQQTPENFYELADTLLHNPGSSSGHGLFVLIQELRSADPDRYANILIEKITAANLPKEETAKFLKIVRES